MRAHGLGVAVGRQRRRRLAQGAFWRRRRWIACSSLVLGALRWSIVRSAWESVGIHSAPGNLGIRIQRLVPCTSSSMAKTTDRTTRTTSSQTMHACNQPWPRQANPSVDSFTSLTALSCCLSCACKARQACRIRRWLVAGNQPANPTLVRPLVHFTLPSAPRNNLHPHHPYLPGRTSEENGRAPYSKNTPAPDHPSGPSIALQHRFVAPSRRVKVGLDVFTAIVYPPGPPTCIHSSTSRGPVSSLLSSLRDLASPALVFTSE